MGAAVSVPSFVNLLPQLLGSKVVRIRSLPFWRSGCMSRSRARRVADEWGKEWGLPAEEAAKAYMEAK